MKITVRANTVHHACVEARRHLGIKLKDSREVQRRPLGYLQWEVELMDGTVVVALVKIGAASEVVATGEVK
jgi:hypothetical protein